MAGAAAGFLSGTSASSLELSYIPVEEIWHHKSIFHTLLRQTVIVKTSLFSFLNVKCKLLYFIEKLTKMDIIFAIDFELKFVYFGKHYL